MMITEGWWRKTRSWRSSIWVKRMIEICCWNNWFFIKRKTRDSGKWRKIKKKKLMKQKLLMKIQRKMLATLILQMKPLKVGRSFNPEQTASKVAFPIPSPACRIQVVLTTLAETYPLARPVSSYELGALKLQLWVEEDCQDLQRLFSRK